MITFIEYLAEASTGIKNSEHVHSYSTRDGHRITVHKIKNEHTLVFKNHSLNGELTKVVHWVGEMPSKQEMESAGHAHDLDESAKMDPDTAGKIAEHSAVIRMAHHLHSQNGTVGSEQHKQDILHHEESIKKLASGKDPADVALRIKHGEVQADAALAMLKAKHGNKIHLTKVGHTSKAGDIGRFTNGKHNDTQENPSDFAVGFKKTQKAKEEHYHGFSAKSSANSSTITAKNPAIHMDNLLDTPKRRFKGEEISRAGLQKTRKDMGHAGKSAADMKRLIDMSRVKEGVTSMSSVEKEANEKSKDIKQDIAKEFHDHVKHILGTKGGHAQIGHMLKKHLTAETSMEWSKVHSKGATPEKVSATVTSGSDNHLNTVFNNPNTKYHVVHHGERVSLYHVHSETGEHVAIAHYSPKTKSNALKSDVHGWNVLPASKH